MKKGTRVRIQKVDVQQNYIFPTALGSQWKPGQDNKGLSPPVHYWVEGVLLDDITLHQPVVMKREIRNGEPVLGYFESSPVTKIEDGCFFTLNSMYEVTEPGTSN